MVNHPLLNKSYEQKYLLTFLHLFVCFHYRFPFNSKQPLGYCVAFILQILSTMSLCSITAVCVAVGFGTFVLSISMTKDIKDDLILINKIAKSRKKRPQALKQFTELIQYHSNAKQLSFIIHNVNFIIMNHSMWSRFISNCFILDWLMIFQMCFNQYLWLFSRGVRSQYVFPCYSYKSILLSVKRFAEFLRSLSISYIDVFIYFKF